jgi:multidrug transporter EmrE-like cation transporter
VKPALESMGYALVLAALLTASHVLLKWATTLSQSGFVDGLLRYFWIYGAALAIYFGIFLWYSQLLRSHSLAVLYPTYTGLSVLFVSLAGVAFFGDIASAAKVIGWALIVAGVILVSVH